MSYVHQVWTMVGVFMGVACVAVLIVAFFMDRLPKELEDQDRSGNLRKDIGKLLVATLKHLKNVPQVLLIPLTMYSGFEQGFFNAEWSKVCSCFKILHYIVKSSHCLPFLI